MNLKPEILQKILDSGESVEWAGRPEPFKAVDSHNRMSVIIRCIVTIVIAALLIVGYFVMVKKSESPVSPWAPLIILAFAIFLLCRPFTDARTLTKKAIFVITDRNAISYISESNFKKMPLSDIDAAQFIDKGNGVGDIILGSDAIKRPYSKIHLTTLMPRESSDDSAKITGMAFYNVAGFENIRSLLPKTVKITDCKLSSMLK